MSPESQNSLLKTNCDGFVRLVMETVSIISHSSVVARENGVPAVASVVDATKILQDGHMIRINGETGVVEVLDWMLIL
jgi:phosphohistidine swiveling domain-containing protein